MANEYIIWPGSEEDEQDPSESQETIAPNPQAMGALRESSLRAAKDLIDSDPKYAGLLDGPVAPPESKAAVSNIPPEESAGTFVDWPVQAGVPEKPEEKGFLNNTARVAGQRALGLAGSTIKGAGVIVEGAGRFMGFPQMVWGGDEGFVLVSQEDFQGLEKYGVSENLWTETLPMAFQDRDLGGVKRHTPENIKAAWAAGDVGGVVSATAKFIGETGIESIPDMIMAAYSIPMLASYMVGRSEEIAEERVRNERLSEALATDPNLSPESRNLVAGSYVSGDDLDGDQLAKSAPFAALSALLERIGAKGIADAGNEVAQQVAAEAVEYGMKAALKEGGKAGAKEAGTEFVQEGILEYFGEKYNTGGDSLTANMSVGEGFERGAFGALAGGGSGTVAGTTIAGARQLMTPRDVPAPDDTGPAPGAPPAGQDLDPDIEAEGESYKVPVDGMDEAEKVALENALDRQAAQEQGSLDLPEPAAPAPETATNPPIAETAPNAPAAADQPTAEPAGDIGAQLKDMVDGNRDAVYLSPEQEIAPDTNMDLGEAVPIENFDGKGGILIAKNQKVADQATKARDMGIDMQQIIGALTRAGKGKPAQGVVVQLKDAEGNVARESVVATPEEAAALQAEWGEGAEVVTTEEALARREALVAQDKTPGPAPAETQSPMIDRKQVETGFRDLNKKTKDGMPGIRKAVRELGTAIAAKFPDAKLPSLKGTIGPKRMADFFAKLDEQVDIRADLPNLKQSLEAILASPDAASAANNFQTLASYVDSTVQAIETGEQGSFLEQANEGVASFDAFERKRLKNATTVEVKDKKTGKPKKVQRVGGPRNRLARRAVAVDELATTVEALVKEASDAGVEVEGDVIETVRRARSYRESSQTARPKTLKGGAGATTTPQKFSGKNLDEVGGKLREAATTIASKMAGTKKAKVDAKVEAVKEVNKKKTAAQLAEVKTAEDVAKDSEPLNPKIAEVVAALNAVGIKTELSGDLYGSGIVYVDVHIPLEDLQNVKLPPGWILDLPLAARTKAHFDTEMDPTQKEYLMSDDFVDQQTVDYKKAKKLGINRTHPSRFSGAVSRLARADSKITKEETLRLTEALKAAHHKKTTAKKAEAVKEVSKKKTAAKKKGKKTIKGVKAEEILDVEPKYTSGKQAGNVVQDLGFEKGVSLNDALEQSGISPKAAATVRGIIEAVPEKAQTKIIQAIKAYRGPDDNLNLVATIEEAVKKPLSPSNMMEILSFVEGMHESRMSVPTYEGNVDLEVLAEAEGLSVEDYREVLRDTGQYVDEIEDTTEPGSDEFFDMSADEFANSQYIVEEAGSADAESFWDLFFGRNMEATRFFRYINDHVSSKSMGTTAPPTNVNDFLDKLMEGMPTNHRVFQLARRLRQLNLNIPVHLFDEGAKDPAGRGTIMGLYHPGKDFDPNTRKIKIVYDGSAKDFIHRAMHEITHAATVGAYRTDPKFKKEIDALYDEVMTYMREKDPNYDFQTRIVEGGRLDTFYGLHDQLEFIAEVMTNDKFQKYLAGIQSRQPNSNRFTNALTRFINAVKKHLGYSVRNSILERAIVLIDRNLQTDQEAVIAGQKLQVIQARLKERPATAAAMIEDSPAQQANNAVLDSQRALKLGIKGVAINVKNAVKQGGRQAYLAISNRDVIERNNRSLFDRAAAGWNIANPLTVYTKAKNSASGLAAVYERKAYQLLKRQQKLKNGVASKLGAMERDTTLSKVNVDQSLKHKSNEHLWTKPNKKTGVKRLKPSIAARVKKARSDFVAFKRAHPEAAQLLLDKAALTKEIRETKTYATLWALGESFYFDESIVEKMASAKTTEDIDAIFDPQEVAKLEAEIANPTGQLFAGKERKKLLKKALSEANAKAIAVKSAKQVLSKTHLAGMYFPLRRFGDFVVSSPPDTADKDRYVSFHSTQFEADSVAAALNKQGEDVHVSLKSEEDAIAKDVTVVAQSIIRRITDPTTKNRIKGAIAEVLAESAAYASQLKRAGVDGVAADDMGRAFEEYVSVSKYTIGDLLVAHKVSESLGHMKMIQHGPNPTLTGNETIKAGEVANEIANQNREEANDRAQSTFQRVVGLIGFANFLGAPSYWALNATQTYTITLPYLVSKWNFKGPPALARSQKVVLGAVGRALNSRDKSYEGFKAQLSDGQRKVVEALETANILQSTIAHELGDMLSPNTMNRMLKHSYLAPVAKGANLALQVMEKVPEAVEHYNRISTALAIYELSGGDMTAVADGVQETQFNYDTGNRARLLKAWGRSLGGGGRPLVTPIMMFKTYGIGLANLLYGAMFDVVYKKGGRMEAAKLAAGLITTHTLFAGVAGGLMTAPVVAIQAAVNAVFKEVDDEWDFEEASEAWARENFNDFTATMVRRGIFAALGIDWSGSVNLGNLIWMSNERLDPNKYGDAERMVSGALGPVAQYGISAYREGHRLLTGDNDGGIKEFLEAAIPLKAYRGMSQAVEYSIEGIKTGSELQLVEPIGFGTGLATALGFQPTAKTEPMQLYYDKQMKDIRRAERRSQLIERLLNNVNANKDLDGVLQDILEYNLSVPEAKYRINAGDRAKLQSRQRAAQRDYNKETAK